MNTDGGEPFHLLLVEDDDGDAFLVEELLAEAGLRPDLTRAWSVQAALDALTVPVDCVLLDLGLPDATGLDALIQLRAASDAAFVVLTGFDGIDGGVEAVAAGAEDYLVKGRVDGESLGRALRYAVERRRGERERSSRADADAGARTEQLATAMPQLWHDAPPAGVRVTVRDGWSDRAGTELFELVARPDETILTLFGHVVGEDPTTAAQAALLRASFRALALAGLPLPAVLEALGRVARSSAVTAQVVVLDLDPGSRRASVAQAGHGGPVLVTASDVRRLGGSAVGAPLGAAGDLARQVVDVVLEEPDRLLLLDEPFVASPAEPAPSAGVDLRDVLAGGGTMDDDALGDAVAQVLRSAPAQPAGGHLVLLGWTAG
ncbi:response regulator [Georgenia sunbinii]|uniref:response regulator n=1 Tax=Georgenia sunbinii TaxID=3117728 RepID=UPI002F26B143